MSRKHEKPSERFFGPEFFDVRKDDFAVSLRPKLRGWGAHGWRVIGNENEMRVEIAVPKTMARPRVPIEAIRIGDKSVKPAVRSSQVGLRRARVASGTNPLTGFDDHPLAPGSRIRLGRGAFQEFVGVAAVLSVDGKPCLLTCGHARAFAFSSDVVPGDEPAGDVIATLARNMLEEPEPLDAALCTLTDAGIALAAASAEAPTWSFRSVAEPRAVDNGREAVFWSSHAGRDDSETGPIESFYGENAALFGPTGPQRGFIETSHGVADGDSGSLLSLGNTLYGLCSGFVGFTSFFTPIAAVVARIKKEASCTVYHPTAT